MILFSLIEYMFLYLKMQMQSRSIPDEVWEETDEYGGFEIAK